MLSRRRKAVVDGGRDQDFYDWLLRPTITLRIQKCAVHIIERWRNDDARLMMFASFGQAREFGQFRQGDIHPECSAACLETLHAAFEFRFQVGIVEHAFVQQFWPDIGDYAVGNNFLTAFKADARNLFAIHQYA